MQKSYFDNNLWHAKCKQTNIVVGVAHREIAEGEKKSDSLTSFTTVRSVINSMFERAFQNI